VTSTADLLSRTPGVQVRRFGGEGQPAEISIRGSTPAQVVVQLDGVPLNSAQSGGVNLATLPLSLLERIEVSRGGGSVQAGSGAIGGVVNLISRRPGGERRSDASFTGGSFGTYRGSAATAGTVRELEYVFAYDGFGTDGDWKFRRPIVDIGGVVIEPDPPTATRINDAADGATLDIAAGTYVENLTIHDKNISLRGANRTTTIIQAASSSQCVITADSNKGTRLENLTITGGHPSGVGGGGCTRLAAP